MRGKPIPWWSALLLVYLAAAAPLHSQLVISEFCAANSLTKKDSDGDASDWVEIANTGPAEVNLAGWSLTDERERPRKWSFPSTNLAGGQLLLVFCSNKDRTTPGGELHTNFRLSGDGEYLALIAPDGQVVTVFDPFPSQPVDVSYGLPIRSSGHTILSRGGMARFLVPQDDALGTSWTTPDFSDSGWSHGATGLGFGVPGLVDTDVSSVLRGSNASLYVRLPFVLPEGNLSGLKLTVRYNDGFTAWVNGVPAVSRNAPVETAGGLHADSLGDWSVTGTQGYNDWFYGFYDRAGDSDGVYDPAADFVTTDPNWTFNGSAWVLGPSNPPWDFVGAEAWHPNGVNNGGEHWVIRRWVSRTSGFVNCALRFAKDNAACGNGVTLRVFQNGQEQLAHTIAFDDVAGLSTNLVLANLSPGDYIDFAIDPTGPDGEPTDSCDGALFSALITQDPSEGARWNSTATASRSLGLSQEAETIDLTRLRDFLVAGTNWLAVQVLNSSPNDTSLLFSPELEASFVGYDLAEHVWFVQPTPGRVNDSGSTNIGPAIAEVQHSPRVPQDHNPLLILARVTPTVRPLGSVSAQYRVMFLPEQTLPLYDDGLHGDGAAGDRLFGNWIPPEASAPGQMVRYFIRALDDAGVSTRSPAFVDPRNSPQYFGTVVEDPRLTNSRLPVLHWFLQNTAGAETDAGARGAFFFQGEFYDNVQADLHGQSTRGFPKKSYDLDFNPGYKFRWSADAPKVGDLNLLTTWGDKTHMRSILAYETYRQAGVPAHFAFVTRVQRNGTFFSVANVVENAGEDFLERLGLDPRGALYSMQNGADSVGMAEKKSRKWEGVQDLQALVTGMGQTTAQARQAYLFDNLDVPEIVNFLATRMLTADTDCCHKNYYLYRDSDRTGEWQALPWDVDLSFGRVWTCENPCLAYFDERIFTNQSLLLGMGNRVFTQFYETPALRQMIMRRLRTLMDELFQPPNTPAESDKLKLRTAELRDQIAPDALLDYAKWGTWGTRESVSQGVNRIWTEFLPGRRVYLYQTMSETRGGPVPVNQPADAIVRFSALEYRPASGNPAEEWLMLTNANAYAVDLSGWILAGGIRFQFKPGTIIAGRSVLYVSPDVKAFRGRTISPKGGERRFVVGPYSGNLSAWGESLSLIDPAGRVVTSTNYVGDPGPAQRYLRVTELFFNPDPFPAAPEIDPELFEFIELRNTGPVALDLRGVRFTQGVAFDFGAGAITNLAAGARVVVVRNLAAFLRRYGPGVPVAGEYEGSLSNSGERVRLEDAAGEKILDFEYRAKTAPLTDGHGFSLVINNDALAWDQWEIPERWRLNGNPGGTPGAADPVPNAIAPVVISEILAHTDPPLADAIELHNPTASAVDISGWFLTDDFQTPRKFRIPSPTVMLPDSFISFTEADFNPNPGVGTSFALSSEGDQVWLFSADSEARLTGYAQGHEFEATANGVSLGRYTNSLGLVEYPAQAQVTLGAPNAGPLSGPIVISEIMFVPGASGADLGASFIELANVSSNNAPLFHPVQVTNTWRLTDPVRFTFPENLVLSPGSHLLVVGFDPELEPTMANAFRSRYGIAPGVTILGPWDGSWNFDESIAIVRPDAANNPVVPYIPVEHVDYGVWTLPMSSLPSPVMSLQRREPAGYANEPGNWFVARTSPGVENQAPVPKPPAVSLKSPADGAAFPAGAALEVSVEATDPDNAVQRVEILCDAARVTTLTSAPYVHTWVPTPGAHEIQAVAYDTSGLSGTSAVVRVGAAQVTNFSVTLVPSQANWKYMDDGVNRGSAWTAPAYSDAAWKSGRAEFGFGDSAEGRPEATVLGFGPSATDKYVTYYFRKAFTATNAFALTEITANLLRDDGAVVHLNGLPLFRSNMPEVSSYSQLALGAVSGADEARFFPYSVDPALIKEGTNFLAIEVHQASRDSSDLSFDFSLTAAGTLLAPVILLHPAPTNVVAGATVALRVRAANTGPLEYSWRRDDIPVPGATGPELVVTNVSPAQAGVYQAVVRNALGAVSSQPAAVVVGGLPPTPGADGLLVPRGSAALVSVGTLLANDIHPTGGQLTVTSVDNLSHAGFPVVLGQGLVTYRPREDFAGADFFSYTVTTDEHTAATGRVEVLVYSGTLPERNRLVLVNGDAGAVLRYHGTPGRVCVLQRSGNLTSWADLRQSSIPPHGIFEQALGQPVEGASYYRIKEER